MLTSGLLGWRQLSATAGDQRGSWRCGRIAAVVLLAAFVATPGQAAGLFGIHEALGPEEPDQTNWAEAEAKLPAYPQEANLHEFEVSQTSRNTYLLDTSSLARGEDNVVRYVLVIRSPGGAVSTSFEGIRCDNMEYRIYATGSHEGSWQKARLSEWRPIQSGKHNHYHAAMVKNFFCPFGTPDTTDKILRALRGKTPVVTF